jgi:alkanesulfonate monooxygenase SsuD/methylene tetrahydromethanopterin reductase-like flavin-dependent oxidoreductase (luciferase family)
MALTGLPADAAARRRAAMSNQQPDFGVMDQGWAAPETSDADAVKASLETIKVADALGFDSAWIGEHHQVRADAAFYGRIPATEVFLAYAAAFTSRIRLGTGVRILSTTPALRTAEEMSLLSLLSGDRVEFGVGLGSGQHGLKSREEKAAEFRRLLVELLGVLRNDPALGLPPLSPVPPADLSRGIWAAARDEPTLDCLAELGVNLVVGQAELGEVQANYVKRYHAAGGRGRTRAVRLVFVAATHDAALEKSRAAADLYFKLMGGNGYRKEAIEKGYLSADVKSREDMLLHINYVVGTPDEVAEQLNAYLALTGVDQLDAMAQIPRLVPADVHESLRLLQTEVRPQLKFVGRRGADAPAEPDVVEAA